MDTQRGSEAGFSLAETIVAIGVLSVGALGLAGVFAQGLQKTIGSPAELVASQKAAEAIESVFSVRDSHMVPWAELRNEVDGGIFLDGPQPLRVAGADGVLNTADDGDVESVVLPGRDQMLGTADDITERLDLFTREIRIVDLSAELRSVTVTIHYVVGAAPQVYTLMVYVSTFA